MSRGVADQVDHEYSERFLNVCREVFAVQSSMLAAGKHVEVYEDAEKIMECVVDRVWRRFLKKVAILRREFLAAGGFEKLDSLLQAWLSWCTAINKGGERSIDMTTFARAYTGGDIHAMFRKTFEIIVDETFVIQSREARLKYFVGMTSLCRAFFKSSFFRDGCRRDFPEAKETFFREIARRLWRVQIYYSGALIFADTWMKHCRATFKSNSPSFSSVWIGNTMPKMVTFPASIRETIADILRRREAEFSEKDIDLWIKRQKSLAFIDSAWAEGRPRILHLHPEVDMINFLHWSGIPVVENAVGSSKRMCELCVRYKRVCEEMSQCPVGLAFTPRCSRAEKVHFENDWMLPDPSVGRVFSEDVVDTVANRAVDEFPAFAEGRFSRLFFNLRHPGLKDV